MTKDSTTLEQPDRRDQLKRRHVSRARKAIDQASTLNQLHKRENDYYYIVRHVTFRESVVSLWAMGYYTDQIAKFIGNGITESVILRTIRSHLAKFQAAVLTAIMRFSPDTDVSENDHHSLTLTTQH